MLLVLASFLLLLTLVVVLMFVTNQTLQRQLDVCRSECASLRLMIEYLRPLAQRPPAQGPDTPQIYVMPEPPIDLPDVETRGPLP